MTAPFSLSLRVVLPVRGLNARRPPLLLFHCGTGSTLSRLSREFLEVLLDKQSMELEGGKDALSVVADCVSDLEMSGLFNAGKGAVAQSDGVVRRDAGVMDGRTLAALGISQVSGIPGMARLVVALLGKSPHVHLSGAMVSRWALRHGWLADLEEGPEDPTLLWEPAFGDGGGGTVGCVARDRAGHLAALTSTGGIGRMWPGRIGDSPIVGAGFYADDRVGAISMTGIGEAILKAGGGLSLLHRLEGRKEASGLVDTFFRGMQERFGGTAGCVGLTSRGAPFVAHSTPTMVHGMLLPSGDRVIAECAG